MGRGLTIGQYYPADSILHRLDPRVKLLGTLVYVITLFFPKSIWQIGIAGVFLVIMIALSRVPPARMLRGIRPLLILILFSAVINLFVTPGEVLAGLGPLTVTKEGVQLACYLIIRLVFLVMGSSLMTLTTTPNQLTAGLEKGLGFLKHVHIPVHEFAMMMSIALRFIPILTEEMHKIMEAQMSRGVDFSEGRFMERGKKLISILIPLFVSSIRRADDLANAMEARCYHGGEGRTSLHPLQYGRRDYAACFVLALYLLMMTAAGFGITAKWF